MRCRKCGKENNDGAKFCAYCGTALSMSDSAGIQSKQQLEENDKEPVNKKKRKKWIWIMLSILVLIAAVAVAGIFITRRFRERQYDNSIAEGNLYLEEMDYEKAEDSFLQAISVDPKQKEPYLKLIDIYTAQEKYDQVVETAEKAKDAVPAEEQGDFEEILDMWEHVIEYTWVVEPEIEADDIFYIFEFIDGDSENETYRQKSSKYAGIRVGDRFGLISNEGTIVVNTDCRCITGLWGWYRLWREDTVVTFNEWEGRITNVEFPGSIELNWYGGYYYYCEGIHNTNEQFMDYKLIEPNTAIPVRQSDRLYETSDNYKMGWPNGLYAIYNNGQLVTDFIYEECGSESAGVLAVKKDGKWGYVRTDGTEVIPAEYDGSWMGYEVETMEDGTYGASITDSYCYAASEGYIVLVKDGVWEMRDTDGNLVMPGGVFEEMRPVYDGRCWVKKNGKWGVIQIKGKTSSSNMETIDDDLDQTQTSEHPVEKTKESSIFTEKELHVISQSLGVPDDLDVEIQTGEPEYYEAGDFLYIMVSIYHDGKLVACANVDIATLKLINNIYTYSG